MEMRMTTKVTAADILAEAADLIDTNGWNPAPPWRKKPGDGLDIIQAVKLAAKGHDFDADACYDLVRLRINPARRFSIADFELAKERRPSEVIALLAHT
jgi:hypothetical protein